MKSEENIPGNLVDMNEAHRQLVADRIEQMESRVRELEQSLLHHATRMYDAVTERLDSLFSTASIAEFEVHPAGTGSISVSEPKGRMMATGLSPEAADTIEMTRQQLALLNRTLQNLQQTRGNDPV